MALTPRLPVWLRPSLTLRIFLAYALFVVVGGSYAIREAGGQVKPLVRQAAEETLVDTANLLAELLAPALRQGRLDEAALATALREYGRRTPQADIWGVRKDSVSHRITLTDARGIVLFDSRGTDVGQDHSRWNDVYLTLRGRYGARTTAEVPGDETSTVMHVAAPLRDGGRIIGVVTLAKPNRSLQPYIDRTLQRLYGLGALLIGGGLLLGALLSVWLSRAIQRLRHYAQAVSAGGQPPLPALPGGELSELAQALEQMRRDLEGKAYVERYVQTLTHELKTPLAAVRAAAEVLRGELPAADRQRFLDHIDAETLRLQQMAERLLQLAQVEQRHGRLQLEAIDLLALAQALQASRELALQAAGLTLSLAVPSGLVLQGERFLIGQALGNLLDNAIDFATPGSTLALRVRSVPAAVEIEVCNAGDPVPDFALPRVTERFYSLPRPGSGRKSTGLGLNFVVEVASLHGGHFQLLNLPPGVCARLTLPA
ncbi:MAG: hypothetical protein RL026_1457 [Pseudomonadota bacterium]|jgi:two-component system sensor histidine kinase CreC